MKDKDDSLNQYTYSVSMNDLMEVWAETFHPFSAILVIWDAKNHFDLLSECGILVKEEEAYENKVVTVELSGVLDAYGVMDSLQEKGYYPFMQVYDKGKLLSDNLGPIA